MSYNLNSLFCFSYSVTDKFQEALKNSIVHLGSWLQSTDITMKHEATHALFKLSNNEDNCIAMYKCGVVKVRCAKKKHHKSLISITMLKSHNHLFGQFLNMSIYIINKTLLKPDKI